MSAGLRIGLRKLKIEKLKSIMLIKLTEFVIAHRPAMRRRYNRMMSGFSTAECAHIHTTLDDNGRTVRCDDCHLQLSAYWLLEQIIYEYSDAIERLKSERAHFEEEKKKELTLLSAQKVEKAWRRRNLVPTCPHCHRGILPTDGFGAGGFINKEIELRRRRLSRDGHAAKSSSDG